MSPVYGTICLRPGVFLGGSAVLVAGSVGVLPKLELFIVHPPIVESDREWRGIFLPVNTRCVHIPFGPRRDVNEVTVLYVSIARTSFCASVGCLSNFAEASDTLASGA